MPDNEVLFILTASLILIAVVVTIAVSYLYSRRRHFASGQGKAKPSESGSPLGEVHRFLQEIAKTTGLIAQTEISDRGGSLNTARAIYNRDTFNPKKSS
jgi:hypothetical protein